VQCPSAYVRNSIKSSQADIYIRLFKTVNVLETDSISIRVSLGNIDCLNNLMQLSA